MLGVLLCAHGLVRQHVHCDRHAGACTIREWPLLAGESLRLDEIREHAFTWRRNGVQWGETVLTDRAGRRVVIGGGPIAAARARYRAFEAFHAGSTDEVELTADVEWQSVIGGVVIFLLAGVWWRERRDELAGRKPRFTWPE